MMTLEAAHKKLTEIDAAIATRLARQDELARERAAYESDREEAAAAVARAWVDAATAKDRDGHARKQTTAEAHIRGLAAAIDQLERELAGLSVERQAAARDLDLSRQVDDMRRTAAALAAARDVLADGIEALFAATPPDRIAIVATTLGRAFAAPTPASIRAILDEVSDSLRRQALAILEPPAPQAAAPLPNDTGIVALQRFSYVDGEGNGREIPKGTVLNVPAPVARAAEATEVAKRLPPRPGFRSVLVGAGAETSFRSLPEGRAAELVDAGTARFTDWLSEADVLHYSSRVSAFAARAPALLPAVALGREAELATRFPALIGADVHTEAAAAAEAGPPLMEAVNG